MKMITIVLALLSAGSSTFADTASPPLVNYEGKLTDTQGTPLAGQHKLEFKIYDAATGGSLVWGPQTFAAVPVIAGQFNVILGTTDGNGKSIADAFGAKDRYLGIKVDDGAEIAPRQQILSAPFALQTQEAAQAKNAAQADNANTLGGRSLQDLLAVIGSSESAAHALTLKSDEAGSITAGYGAGKLWFTMPFHLKTKAQILFTLITGNMGGPGYVPALLHFTISTKAGTQMYRNPEDWIALSRDADGNGGGNFFGDAVELEAGSYVIAVDVSGWDSSGPTQLKSGHIVLEALPSP